MRVGVVGVIMAVGNDRTGNIIHYGLGPGIDSGVGTILLTEVGKVIEIDMLRIIIGLNICSGIYYI